MTGYESISSTAPDSIDKYISDFADDVKAARKNLDENDTHLQNMLDEIISLAYSTVYKLRYLK